MMMEDETQRDKQETAAANLTFQVADLLLKAFYSRPDLGVEEIAERVGVTPKRVEEILTLGDDERAEGNMYVVTLGRYLRAMGYTLKLQAVVADDEDSPEADADKVNRNIRRGLRPNDRRERAQEIREAYEKSLPGVVYGVLGSLDAGSLPFEDYLHTVMHAGYTAREAVQFMSDEASTGNLVIHDDGSVSAVKVEYRERRRG